MRWTGVDWKLFAPFTDPEKISPGTGFRLSACGRSYKDLYTASSAILDQWISAFSRTSILTDIEQDIVLYEEIGVGSFSHVFRGQSVYDSSQYYAVKRIEKKHLDGEKRLAQISTEIEVLRRLQHPNVVQLFHVYENVQYIDLVLEYVPNGSLEDYLNSKGRLQPKEVEKLCTQLTEVMDFLHRNGVTHRDIKPANVLYSSGNWKLTDFGLAAQATQDLTDRCGSPGYLAPEVICASNYTCKVDVFSAGITLLTAATNMNPFAGLTWSEMLLSSLKGNMSTFINGGTLETRVFHLLQRMLDPDPDRRPNAQELVSLCTETEDLTPKGALPVLSPKIKRKLLRKPDPPVGYMQQFWSLESAVSSVSTAPSPSE